ncbi:MAG TPA: DUF6298 domain-containing protein [Steroidobacteraceae bacterium]|nr:DUF6298 domain-containing protein [Steroidobacteraceae bacterium]
MPRSIVAAFRRPRLLALVLAGIQVTGCGAGSSHSRAGGVALMAHPIQRPATLLRVSSNGRYFENAAGQVVELSGSHTWSNLQDNGHGRRPLAFDYDAYLNFLQANGHDFFRLYVWEQSRWTLETADEDYWFYPETPYERTGPGRANDGEPKFDLSKLNQTYFDRLRARVAAAGKRGIYVSIMLFDGWSVAKVKGASHANNPWRGHPFNSANNINGINGDPNGDGSGEETHELLIPAVTAIQDAYVRKVIDTVNDLDNVLYEISNESGQGSQRWQYHMIDLIKSYEAGKPKQHPVGMTVIWPDGDNADLLASHADWISPNGDAKNPPLATGAKVIVSDTDHLCGKCGDREWVWKSFTRGENPIFMDAYDGAGYGVGGNGFKFDDPRVVDVRRNLGFVVELSRRFDLRDMLPHADTRFVSTGYALADPSSARYIVYLPPTASGRVSVDLSGSAADLTAAWLDPTDGLVFSGGPVHRGGPHNFTAPFDGDAVLMLEPGGSTGLPK